MRERKKRRERERDDHVLVASVGNDLLVCGIEMTNVVVAIYDEMYDPADRNSFTSNR